MKQERVGANRNGQTVADMKESGGLTKQTDKASFIMLTVTFMKEAG